MGQLLRYELRCIEFGTEKRVYIPAIMLDQDAQIEQAVEAPFL